MGDISIAYKKESDIEAVSIGQDVTLVKAVDDNIVVIPVEVDDLSAEVYREEQVYGITSDYKPTGPGAINDGAISLVTTYSSQMIEGRIETETEVLDEDIDFSLLFLNKLSQGN